LALHLLNGKTLNFVLPKVVSKVTLQIPQLSIYDAEDKPLISAQKIKEKLKTLKINSL